MSNDRTLDVAVISGARTPFARMGTALRGVPAVELARRAMQETLSRAARKGAAVDEVILGNVVMPADAANPARVAAIWAGVPENVPALTVQRNCASGLEAIADAAQHIRDDQAATILAGGTESMSGVPLLFPTEMIAPMTRLARARGFWQRLSALGALRPWHFRPVAALELGLTDPTCGLIMGKTAEVLAQEFSISRREQDTFALRSHQRAVAAANAGSFAEEIVPVFVGREFKPVLADVGPRPEQNMEALAKLKPIFDKRDGTVTVGNSCQVTDGAATVLLARSQAVGDIEPLGYVRDYAYVGLNPAHMGLGPVYAIDRLLRQTGLGIGDIDLWEINEAFAAQVLACLKAMESATYCQEHLDRPGAIGAIDPERLNVNGGAIALGHPVGATGARLVLTLLYEMRRRNAHLGVVALCVGGGQGAALLLERR
jgi:acetyl-CoA C-acetyltransferase/acetyl-CoA acyltransferase